MLISHIDVESRDALFVAKVEDQFASIGTTPQEAEQNLVRGVSLFYQFKMSPPAMILHRLGEFLRAAKDKK